MRKSEKKDERYLRNRKKKKTVIRSMSVYPGAWRLLSLQVPILHSFTRHAFINETREDIKTYAYTQTRKTQSTERQRYIKEGERAERRRQGLGEREREREFVPLFRPSVSSV